MLILDKLFGAKAIAITSAMIHDEIANAESEIAAHRTKLSGALSAIAVMSDAEHVKAEADIAATKRAIARLESRIAHLDTELPKVISSEETAAKIAADEALRRRADASRKANTKEAAALLRDYDKLAGQIGGILARLDEIANETNNVNGVLRLNPVTETIASYSVLHRKHPDQPRSERRAMRPTWVYDDGTTEEARLDAEGNPKRAEPKWGFREQRFLTPRLENREVVVGRTDFRPGRYEDHLGAIHLPPGFAGGITHWPRKS